MRTRVCMSEIMCLCTYEFIYIYIYMYVLFSPVKQESGIIRSGQLNYSTTNI